MNQLIENYQTKCPIGDRMHNWAFQIGYLGLEIEDWDIGWNRLK